MNKPNNHSQHNPSSIGAIWVRQSSKNGEEYLSLKIELEGKEYLLKAFLNSKKKSPEDPKPLYIIYHSQNNKDKNKEENYNRREKLD